MKKVLKLSVISIVLISACHSKEGSIKGVKFWKYAEGTSFSDLLRFSGKEYAIKNDTIFNSGIPQYEIQFYERRILSNDRVLQLKELKTGKTARYVSK